MVFENQEIKENSEPFIDIISQILIISFRQQTWWISNSFIQTTNLVDLLLQKSIDKEFSASFLEMYSLIDMNIKKLMIERTRKRQN